MHTFFFAVIGKEHGSTIQKRILNALLKFTKPCLKFVQIPRCHWKSGKVAQLSKHFWSFTAEVDGNNWKRKRKIHCCYGKDFGFKKALYDVFSSQCGISGLAFTWIMLGQLYRAILYVVFCFFFSYSCEAPEVFCGLWNFTWLSISILGRKKEWLFFNLGELIL